MAMSDRVKITPTQSHEDLVAQMLLRQSPSVGNMLNPNSIAKTPSQAEFEQFFQAHAAAQAQAMMANNNNKTTPGGGGGGGSTSNNNNNNNNNVGGMTQSGSGQDFTSMSPTEIMNNNNASAGNGSAEQPPKGIPKVASLDMLRTMFFQSGMANGGTTGVPGMTPGNMLGLMQNPYGGSNPNLANLGQQFMQNIANTTTGFTPPGVPTATTTRTGKPGRPRGSTKNGNASTTAALKGNGVQKQNSKKGSMKSNDGLEALAMATAASDAKNSKKGADAASNKRAAPGATTLGGKETSTKPGDDSNNKKSKTSRDNDTATDEDNTAEHVKKNKHVQLGENEDEDDPEMAEIRRQRRMLSNRESARRSRRRKLDHVAQLEGQIASLQREQALLLERYRQSEEAREHVFRENSVLKKELAKKGVDVNAMLMTNIRQSPSAENLANMTGNNAAAIAAAVAAGANTYTPKQNSGSISNLPMSAGPSNVNLADVSEGMLRIPSMPRISSVGDLVKRTISSEALANFEQQQAAIAAQMASGAAGLMAGGAQQNGASKDGASPRGFVPFRPTSSYQNLLEAAKLAESAEKEKKNNAKKAAAAAAASKK